MNQSQTDIVPTRAAGFKRGKVFFGARFSSQSESVGWKSQIGISAIWAFETTERLLSIFKVKYNERTLDSGTVVLNAFCDGFTGVCYKSTLNIRYYYYEMGLISFFIPR